MGVSWRASLTRHQLDGDILDVVPGVDAFVATPTYRAVIDDHVLAVVDADAGAHLPGLVAAAEADVAPPRRRPLSGTSVLRRQIPSPGAVCPAMVRLGLLTSISVSRLIVPETRKTTVSRPPGIDGFAQAARPAVVEVRHLVDPAPAPAWSRGPKAFGPWKSRQAVGGHGCGCTNRGGCKQQNPQPANHRF